MARTLNLLVWALCCLAPASAFAFSRAGGNKSNAATEEAVAIFGKNFPYNRAPPKQTSNVGVPYADIDGTRIRNKNGGRRLTDLTEKQVAANFKEMAKVYGEEQALEMVKIMPVSLSFNAKNFAPSLKCYAEEFGLEESKEMVARNVRSSGRLV